MVGKIIALVSCVMCALPFFIIAKFNKDSREPVSFWSGDTSLKGIVKNVPEYNKEMCAMYGKCGIAFLITGAAFLLGYPIGIILLVFDCTLGIYVVYRIYKKILAKYS